MLQDIFQKLTVAQLVKITHLLWNRNVYYNVHMGPTLDQVLST